MTQAQQANGRMLDVASAHSPARANRSIGSPIRYRADTVTWAQALLPYPRGSPSVLRQEFVEDMS